MRTTSLMISSPILYAKALLDDSKNLEVFDFKDEDGIPEYVAVVYSRKFKGSNVIDKYTFLENWGMEVDEENLEEPNGRIPLYRHSQWRKDVGWINPEWDPRNKNQDSPPVVLRILGNHFVCLGFTTWRYQAIDKRSCHLTGIAKGLAIETRSWPYDFPYSEDYPHADQRGTVTGRLQVRDWYFT
ncbi:hypothetical protein LguiA_031950 [Lonicera macranthoides]